MLEIKNDKKEFDITKIRDKKILKIRMQSYKTKYNSLKLFYFEYLRINFLENNQITIKKSFLSFFIVFT